DEPVRWGVIATVFWSIVGLFAGLWIALQLRFPELNFGEHATFGRLRPLHTSAVIFAFGGNALIATSYYVVQRACRARLAFPRLARSVLWGYQLFIVLAARGYVLGVTHRRSPGPRIPRAGVVRRPVADHSLHRLPHRLRRLAAAPVAAGHLRRALVLSVGRHHHRAAAPPQQPRGAGRPPRLRIVRGMRR